MSQDLKPCPFCGCHGLSTAWPREFRGRMVAIIECHTDNCYAFLTAETPDKAVAAWNRRAEGAPAAEGARQLPADPASVLPVLAHLVATGEATDKQRAELAAALSPPAAEGKEDIPRTLRATIQLMYDEYQKDECCDLVRLNGLIELAYEQLSNHPAPAAEPVAISRGDDTWTAIAEIVARTISDTAIGRVRSTSERAGKDADAILAKMKPNLKEEGGLSQSQPSGVGPSDLTDHDPQHSGGGEG